MKKPPDKFWFPSLLQSAINVKSNSWFNISCKYNPNKVTTKKETFKSSYIVEKIKIGMVINKQYFFLFLYFI